MSMKRYVKLNPLTLLLLLISVLAYGCGNNDNHEKVYSKNPEKISYIKITNDGSSEVGFNVVVDGKPFFTKVDDIITEISNMPSDHSLEPFHRKIWVSFTKEPFHRKLWRYLIKNRYHFDPYTGAYWGHSPVLYLNSLGFGYCDDVAAVYYALATRFGYKARIWDLHGSDSTTGHNVPEVLVNNHWEMYDPDMEVYYWNKTGQIAGLEELGEYRELITSPIHPLPVTHFSAPVVTSDDPPIPFAYTELVADIYSSGNRRIEPDYYNQADVPQYAHPFTLPPKAYLEFPVPIKQGRKLLSCLGTEVPDYDLMRLVLPKGWSGSVKFPLVFLAIKGSGKISLNKSVYDLDSLVMADHLNRDGYIYQASIKESFSDIEILFLVNKKRFDLGNISGFKIRSKDSNLLTVVYK